MSLKVTISHNQVLNGITAIVTAIQNRKPSKQFDNAVDVQAYPYNLRLAVIKDRNNLNLGQQFVIKLVKVDNLKIGQQLNFDKLELTKGKATLWANQRGYVQISLKGDKIDVKQN